MIPAVGLALAVLALPGPASGQSREVILATTSSVRDAGLLDTLLPPFERQTGIAVRVIAVGSGQAMALARRGEADIVILHDPPSEHVFVAEGFGIDRRSLMRNEFVLVGPPDDGASVRGLSIAEAFRRIAAARARFVSRGDRSGTHARERLVWTRADVSPNGPWYLETGQGMGATLVIADQLRAYTLTDIGTWLANQAPFALAVLVDDDPMLANPYHVIRVNPDRFVRVNAEAALELADYLTSTAVQELIGQYGVRRFGRPLFTPTATRGP